MTSVRAMLEYAAAEPGDPPPVRSQFWRHRWRSHLAQSQAILGGNKVLPIGAEGRVVFDNLYGRLSGAVSPSTHRSVAQMYVGSIDAAQGEGVSVRPVHGARRRPASGYQRAHPPILRVR